jgi:hypothetical protein
MALGQTVEAAIVEEVIATLGTITSANDAFNTDLVRVYEMYGNVLELAERPCLVVVPLPSPRSHNCPNGLERVDLKLSISCVMDIEAADPIGNMAPWHEPIRLFANDVEKALRADLQRNSMAIDTIIESVDIFEAAQGVPVAAAEVTVSIPFRHLTTDPTQAQ